LRATFWTFVACAGLSCHEARAADPPRVYMLDGPALLQARELLRSGDVAANADAARILQAADRALRAGPYSVIHKSITPPSGDKRDYMSLAPYWWPDPNTADGLPYIRRDGERNPEIDQVSDKRQFNDMASAVETLALGSWLCLDDRKAAQYADRAGLLLDAWFRDETTRMNPHLRYGQAIRGVNDGRGIGIIETRVLARLVDALGLLAESPAWTPERRQGVEAWLGEYLDWLRESDHGRDEADESNNHGTIYDVQVASLALYLGRESVAREVLNSVGERRIAAQVEPDGRQPLELARTRAWSYSVANLEGLMILARLGESVDADIWQYKTRDGRSIRRALDFLAPFDAGEKEWPYPQIDGKPIALPTSLLRLAGEQYPDGPYAETAAARGAPLLPAAAFWRSPTLPANGWR
jgi:hypothetical protein